MSDFEYRIAAQCKDGTVSRGRNSSPHLQKTSELADQLRSSGEFSDVWVERGTLSWERIR